MSKLQSKRLFAQVLSFLLLLQLIPIDFAFAITPSDITGTKYLTVHGTDFVPSEQASSLKITQADGITIISPDTNGNYSAIPAGAKIILDYAFNLVDGDGSTIYDYDGNEYFTASLPSRLNFQATTGTLVANDSTDGNYDMATWSISGNTLQVNLTTGAEDLLGQGGAANDAHVNKWGKIHLEATFNALNVGDDTTQTINFGSQTIVINRQPLPMKSTLAKSGIYDASTNQIIWTVTVTPPAGAPGLAFDGHSLIDKFSANQAYVIDSFISGGTSVSEALLTIDNANREISYTFPDTDPDTTGIQTVIYRTTPTDFSLENGISAEYITYSNTVNLLRGSDSAADPATRLINLDWINKTGNMVNTSAADPTIVRWNVDVTVPGVTGQDIKGAVITDTIPADLELLVDISYPISIKFGSAVATYVNNGVGEGEYGYAGNILTYRFPTLNQPTAGTTARLTFYTKVTAASWSSYLSTNSAINFSNNASLDWIENETSTSPSDGYTISNGIGSGGLLSKSGGASSTYNYSLSDPGTMHWTITVNRNKINIVNAKITDIIPTTQTMLIDASHPLTVQKVGTGAIESVVSAANTANFTYTDANNFIYKFPEEVPTDTISSTYTVDYYTRIGPAGLVGLYKNSTVRYYNGVTLTRDSGPSISYTGEKAYLSEMLAKSIATAYNYDPLERTVQWGIVVNKNNLPLNNPVLSDTLPLGLTLLIDGAHPFTVAPSGTGGLGTLTGLSGDSSFTYTLPTSTSDQYILTFWSKMSESALKAKWSGLKAFTNQAFLDSDEIGAPISVTVSANIKNPIISKTYSYTPGNDTIDWSVIINPAQATLQNGVVTDTLNSSLQLESASIQLYTVTIDASTGEANAGGTLVDPSTYTVTMPTMANGNALSIALPASTSLAYRLDFRTGILTDDINLSNTISLLGSAGDSAGSSTSNQIVVNDLYSSGGSGTNTLTVHKTDSSANPLSGATFRLLNVNKQPITKNGSEITKITNGSGDAVFPNLPSWVFYVEEIEPTTGYLIPGNAIFGGNRISGSETINVTDSLALTDVTFNKTGAAGALLSGGVFTLTGQDYASNPVIVNASAINGEVTFENIAPNKTGVPYNIAETTAPEGHVVNAATLSATVVYNTAKNDLIVTVNPDTLVNTPLTGTVYFTKTGTGGSLLSGGSFRLSGTDYDSNPINIAGIAAAGGTVTFGNVPIGNYVITEVTPPDGYLMPNVSTILTATVAYSAGNNAILSTIYGTGQGTSIVSSYADKQALGTISFTKTDSFDNSGLSGGTFVLRGKDNAGNDVSIAASSIGGTVTFNEVPLGDDYTIKETVSPSGYRLNTLELKASVKYNADKTSVVTSIMPNTLSNDRAPQDLFAKVSVVKTDEAGNKLTGAVFTLYDKVGNEIAKAISGIDGVADFGNIVKGVGYEIKETKAPEGYEINTEVITFAVSSTLPLTYTVNDKLATIVMNGKLQITKVDKEYHPLAGAEFTLYDQDGNSIKRLVTGNNGIVMFAGLVSGKYSVKETTAPEGYALFSDPVEFQISDANPYQAFALKNATIDIDEEAGVAGWIDVGGDSRMEILPNTGGNLTSLLVMLFGLCLTIAGIILRRAARCREKRS